MARVGRAAALLVLVLGVGVMADLPSVGIPEIDKAYASVGASYKYWMEKSPELGASRHTSASRSAHSCVAFVAGVVNYTEAVIVTISSALSCPARSS